jgi:hypothetical protein
MALPFAFGRKCDKILVMFAGCGKQMIDYYRISEGNARIIGVELNPQVKKFAESINGYGLSEFYNLPNIEFITKEGRSFLNSADDVYDLIYVGSDAATTTYKTGHSRKYLDTYEAMVEYVDHLNSNGIIIFHAQPSKHKLKILQRIFYERGFPPLSKCVAVITRDWDHSDFLLISLKPFSEQELSIIRNNLSRYLVYLPNYEGNKSVVSRCVAGDFPAMSELVTDNRPFIHTIDFKRFALFPAQDDISSGTYYRSWIAIMTLIMIAVLVFLVISVLFFTRTPMPPVPYFLLLVITGFCYMLCEVVYIARLELYLGNPLLSMALLLFIFLTANSQGSRFFNWITDRIRVIYILLIVVSFIFITHFAINVIVREFLSLPILAKIPITIVIMSPVAFCLGLFYPYIVSCLAKNHYESTIPITYGLSTLSSTLGATYAMILIINFGYTNIFIQAAIGYLLCVVILLIPKRGINLK